MEQQVEALKQNAELRAFNTVVELIRQREIVPGQRLFEPDLSKRLSMSRTPLRTALSRLVAEGILVKERGRKGYLLPALSSEDMRQIFYSRAAVEGAAAARLAHACTPEHVMVLRAINAKEAELFGRERQTPEEKAQYAQLNEELHRLIVSFSGNVYLLRFFNSSYWRSTMYTLLYTRFYRERTRPTGENVPSWKEHSLIIDALEAHEAERSRRLMEEHVLNTFRYRSLLEDTERQ